MNLSIKSVLIAGGLLIGLSFGVYKVAFSSACCGSTATTSGCTPSNCRGAKTKFGEAQVISDLRLNLIALKSDMEQSEQPTFDEKSYDIHGIIGDTDDESLEIIIDAIKVIEEDFAAKMNHQPSELELPNNKAKQVAYLNDRIENLKTLL